MNLDFWDRETMYQRDYYSVGYAFTPWANVVVSSEQFGLLTDVLISINVKKISILYIFYTYKKHRLYIYMICFGAFAQIFLGEGGWLEEKEIVYYSNILNHEFWHYVFYYVYTLLNERYIFFPVQVSLG